jgi:ribosome biogenesis GTPase A
MPFINWYPGHIAKAERKLKEQISLVDMVIEVIDARIPLSSKYIEVEKLIGEKPRLLVLNKADLSDQYENLKWVEYLTKKTGLAVILTSASSSKDLSRLIKAAVDTGKEKIEQLLAKGLLPRPVRAMVIGMPNVGKSSLINKLIKTTKTKVGAKAGVTRSSQWIRINPKLDLLDTPGIIPIKLEDQERAVKLAVVNSISENAYNFVEVAQELVNILYFKYPDLLKDYYNLKNIDDLPTLEDIALARNWILQGEIPDVNRCASSVLADFRHGRIGRITLDNTAQIQNS